MSKKPAAVELPQEHDKRLANQVGNVLKNVSETGLISFNYAGVQIAYYQYYFVGQSVHDGFIFVARDAGKKIATYNPDADYMLFPLGFEATDYASKATIIHEGTHAVCDMLKVTMMRSDAEMIGYVAQAMYLRANSPDYTAGQKPPTDDYAGPVRKAAFAIGDDLLLNKVDSSKAFTPTRVQAIKRAMHPIYGFTGKKDKTVFNGIGGTWRLGRGR